MGFAIVVLCLCRARIGVLLVGLALGVKLKECHMHVVNLEDAGGVVHKVRFMVQCCPFAWLKHTSCSGEEVLLHRPPWSTHVPHLQTS